MSVDEVEAQVLRGMAGEWPSMLAEARRDADKSRIPQTVFPSRWIGDDYVGADCVLISTAACGDRTGVPPDAHPNAEPLLTILPARYLARQVASIDALQEYAASRGADVAEQREFARWWIRQEFLGADYDSEWRLWRAQKTDEVSTTTITPPARGGLIFVYDGPGLVTRLEGWAINVIERVFGDGPAATRDRMVAVYRNTDGELDIAATAIAAPLAAAETAWHLVTPAGDIVGGGPRGRRGEKPSMTRAELEEMRDSGTYAFQKCSVAVQGIPETARRSPSAEADGATTAPSGPGFTAAGGGTYQWCEPPARPDAEEGLHETASPSDANSPPQQIEQPGSHRQLLAVASDDKRSHELRAGSNTPPSPPPQGKGRDVGEIAPAIGVAPQGNAEGPANGYTAVQAKLRTLQAAADALQEMAAQVAQRMRNNGDAAVALSEMCAAAEVAPTHTGALESVAEAFGAVASGGRRLAADAETMGHSAGMVIDQHRTEYGGIYEAANASAVPEAKPGFYIQR